MNDHRRYEDSLPLYATGRLDERQRAELEAHLRACPACQADLGLWQALAGEITAGSSRVSAPPRLAERTLERIHAPAGIRRAFLRAAALLRAQAYLIQREMWPAAAAVMAIGLATTFLVGKVAILRFFAPLVAAASLAAIFGPEHDPACELTQATPTSPWKVLLARLTLVHGYNLVLTLAASLFLLALVPAGMLGAFILGWLGPMTFLAALALLLSLWIGTANSLAVICGLWIVQFPRYELALSPSAAAAWMPVLDAYRQFWASPPLLIGLGLLLLVLALWSAGRLAPRLARSPA